MTRDEIQNAVNLTFSANEACKMLNISSYQLFVYAKQFGIELKKNKGGKGTRKRRKEGNGKFLTEDILLGKHPEYQTKNLKSRLIEEGIKMNKCEICGLTEWNGASVVMQLHHKDGNSKNHCLENLQMLCPNCHSQTDTFSGKNVKSVL